MAFTSIAACCVVILTLADHGRAIADTQPPSADSLHAYVLGQAYVRSFEDYLQPGICSTLAIMGQ